MDYKYITANDKFIDDVNSKRYHTWVSGSTNAKSYDPILIKPYRYGTRINYDMHPTIAKKRQCYFHTPNSPTAGCIALKKTLTNDTLA